jgi:hypothetical protein
MRNPFKSQEVEEPINEVELSIRVERTDHINAMHVRIRANAPYKELLKAAKGATQQ